MKPPADSEFTKEKWLGEQQVEDALTERRERLAAIESDIAISEATAELQQHYGWQKLLERLKSIEAGLIRSLIYESLSPQRLGRLQGRVQQLRTMTLHEPRSPQAVDALREEASMLAGQITELSNLL